MTAPKFTQCQAAGCHNLIGPPRYQGPPRKWCSEPCRITKYSRPCVDCGRPLTGCNGHGENAPQRCGDCDHERQRVTSERAAVALEMWRLREAEGLLNTEIAQRVNRSRLYVPSELYRLRAAGFSVPKAAYNGADKRDTTASVRDEQCDTLEAGLARLGVYPPDIGLPWREPTELRSVA